MHRSRVVFLLCPWLKLLKLKLETFLIQTRCKTQQVSHCINKNFFSATTMILSASESAKPQLMPGYLLINIYMHLQESKGDVLASQCSYGIDVLELCQKMRHEDE